MAKTQDGDNGKPAKRPQPKARAQTKRDGGAGTKFIAEKAILKDISYHLGRISRRAVDGIKESMDTDSCKKIGKNVGAFYNHIENGWENPDEIFEKDDLSLMDTSSVGQVIGSCARSSTDLLSKTYKVATGYLGRAYKKGRIATLIAMWKIENPGASKTRKQEAVSEINKLFRS